MTLRAWIAVGIGLRLAAFFACAGYAPVYDPAFYLGMARNLLEGHGLVHSDPVYGDDLRAIYPPLYPLLLALSGVVLGVSMATAMLLNTVIDVFTARILARIDARAGALFFCWPTVVLSSITAQKESLVWLLVVSLVVLALQRRGPMLFGAVSGLLLLTQPALLALPIVLFVFFWRQNALLVAAAALAVMAPWWVRNWIVFGAFVPLTSSGGLSLAVVTNGRHIAPAAGGGELERFAAAGWDAARWIVQHPLDYLFAVAKQVALSFGRENFALARAHPNPPLWATIGLQLSWFALLARAAFCRDRSKWLLFAVSGLALVPMVWFEFGERHRYFLLPMLLMLGCYQSMSTKSTQNLDNG